MRHALGGLALVALAVSGLGCTYGLATAGFLADRNQYVEADPQRVASDTFIRAHVDGRLYSGTPEVVANDAGHVTALVYTRPADESGPWTSAWAADTLDVADIDRLEIRSGDRSWAMTGLIAGAAIDLVTLIVLVESLDDLGRD